MTSKTRLLNFFAVLTFILLAPRVSHAQAPPSEEGATTAKSGVLNAASFNGADIGAKINHAIAALPGGDPTTSAAGCGTVTIPTNATPYSFSTTIIKPRCVVLRGEGTLNTILKYTGTTTGLVIADSHSQPPLNFSNLYPPGEIADFTLEGSCEDNAGCVGIYFGGDPSPTKPRSPAKDFGDHQNVNRVRVTGFGVGVQWGSNSWSHSFHQSVITSNGIGLNFPCRAAATVCPNGIVNSGESIVFTATSIQNNKMGINQVGFSFFQFFGSRCDYNKTCGIVTYALFSGMHFEQCAGPILSEPNSLFQPVIMIEGGEALLEASKTDGPGCKGVPDTDPAMFEINAANNATFILRGTHLFANHSVRYAVDWMGSAAASVLNIDALPYYVRGGNIKELTNATCNFWGCHIHDGQSGTDLEGGNVQIAGSLSVQGAKKFQIDDPVDPEHKYLEHASIESSEMMNIYSGNVTTDAEGEATVRLPEWFEALNTDFRYQLTVVRQFAQAIVAREIQDHEFAIRTNAPNVKVSWQVTGVRQDAYAKAHPLLVEEEKAKGVTAGP
jgi:hypothetical protein